MQLPNGQEVSGFQVIMGYVLLFWFVATFTWQWRNPTANLVTCYSYINHVVKFDKLPEFQVEHGDPIK